MRGNWLGVVGIFGWIKQGGGIDDTSCMEQHCVEFFSREETLLSGNKITLNDLANLSYGTLPYTAEV